MLGVWLETLTWPEAKQRLEGNAVVVVPIGAAAKEHGHHLPLNTDYLLARALAEGVAAALPVVIAPIVCFGYYPAFLAYPGSQHLRAETFIALMTDILSKLIADGAKRIGDQYRRVDRGAAADRRAHLKHTSVRVATASGGWASRRTRGGQAGSHADVSSSLSRPVVRLDRAVSAMATC
jgi:hypothetical protein